MKIKILVAATSLAVVAVAANYASAADNGKKDNGKKKDASTKIVDSGSFGVFQGGKRVATETFSIEQSSSGSVATSQFKTESGTGDAAQSSTLDLTPTGEVTKYEWKETSPGKAEAVVTPSENFLTERYRDNPQDKQTEQPFLLPASTSILDDYFFVQREILAWKYLAMACRTEKGQLQCPIKQEVKFGTLNPHMRLSVPVSLAFMGNEKVMIHGTEQNLTRLDLKSDTGGWSLWLDPQLKVMRILAPETNTEVIRD